MLAIVLPILLCNALVATAAFAKLRADRGIRWCSVVILQCVSVGMLIVAMSVRPVHQLNGTLLLMLSLAASLLAISIDRNLCVDLALRMLEDDEGGLGDTRYVPLVLGISRVGLWLLVATIIYIVVLMRQTGSE